MVLTTGKVALDSQNNVLPRCAARKSYGSGVGYITAKGFLWAAEAGMQHVWDASASEDAESKLRENSGVVISAAINLSISAELAIKCLLVASGKKVPWGHDLFKLYKKIPEDLRIQLSEFYEKNLGSNNCVIHFGASYNNNKEAASSNVISGSLEEAIQRSRRTFDEFRFIYEIDSKPETYQADFHFGELRFIVETLLRPCTKTFGDADIYVKKDSNVDFSRGSTRLRNHDGLTAVQLTVEVANQLAEPARYFLKKHTELPSEEQSQSASVEIWRLPATVVGLTLAVEMCFKSICLALKIPYNDDSHSLIDGYQLLRKKAKIKIKEEFEQQIKDKGVGRSYAFIWSDGKINQQEIDDEMRSKVRGMNIEAILDRTSRSFEDWRYCYEKRENSTQRVLEIPLGAMVYLVDAAIATAVAVQESVDNAEMPGSAIADYTKALKLACNNATGYINRGNAYARQDTFDMAIADYTKALQLAPDNVAAYINRGNAYVMQENFEIAIADFTEILRLDSDYINAYLGRGFSYTKQDNFEAAIADYTAVLRLDPDYIDAYHSRGFAHTKQDNFEAAIADYTAVLRLDPDYIDAYHSRGFAYAKQDNFEAAITDYTEVLRLDPGHVMAYINRGFAYFKLGDDKAAIVEYTKALKLDPNSAQARNDLGFIKAKVGRCEI